MVASVAVAALPVSSPINPVAVILPVLGLYVKSPSDSNPRFPPSTSPPAVKIIAFASSVDSLSVIVTVVALIAPVPVKSVSARSADLQYNLPSLLVYIYPLPSLGAFGVADSFVIEIFP